jgi:HSP20 family protein
MQAPGFERDDIEISVRNGVLEVRGERKEKEEHKDSKRSYVVREQNSSFARRIVLPEGAESDNVAAELDNGVLKVTLPIHRPEAKRIEIAKPVNKVKDKITAIAGKKSEPTK